MRQLASCRAPTKELQSHDPMLGTALAILREKVEKPM